MKVSVESIPEEWLSGWCRDFVLEVCERVGDVPNGAVLTPFQVFQFYDDREGIGAELSWRRFDIHLDGDIRKPGYCRGRTKLFSHDEVEEVGAGSCIWVAKKYLVSSRPLGKYADRVVVNSLYACTSCHSSVSVLQGRPEGGEWTCFDCDDDAGYVYVLSNPHMDCLKVGYTTQTPEKRAKSLSKDTACPAPFEVEAAFKSRDVKALESEVHDRLQLCRVSKSSEFFDCTVDDVRRSVLSIQGQAPQAAAE